ncbi:hypothetical protein LguiA_011690 [Lonicera macranthoides]
MAVSMRCLALLALMLFVSVNAITEKDDEFRKSSVEETSQLQSPGDSTMVDRSNDEGIRHEHAVDDPEHVASMVDMTIRNSTERRNLGFFSCGTGNPIDDCWRCDRNWMRNRRRLADCSIGFGRNAIGGRDGRFYVVSDPKDDDPVNPRPGTLRHAVIQDRPLWIVFKRDMVITLKQELIMNSFKTIDARGVNVHIANGGCITIQFITNVIIHGLHIHDCKPTGNAMVRSSPSHYGWRTMADGDAISIFGCRHGYFHVVNNDYTHWEMYAIGGSADPTINSQGNRYLAPANPFAKQVTHRVSGDWKGWNWRSEGDLLLNGAYFIQSGTRAGASYARASSLGAKSSSMVASLTSGAGALSCRRGFQC